MVRGHFGSHHLWRDPCMHGLKESRERVRVRMEQQESKQLEKARGVAVVSGTLAERFEERAKERPWATALSCGEQSLSYGELSRRANRVAWRLRAEGVGPETIVGLSAERTLGMVVGLLGIAKAGGAYLPLDASYPSE